MSDSFDYKELVEKSQQGDDESLNRLSGLVRDQLYTYVYRLTMRDELTQDVVQESMLQMFRFLDKLENADRFWPWLRQIALNQVRHHYTREKARGMVSMTDSGIEVEGDDGNSGFSNLVTEELREIVAKTMGQMRSRYREVLVMRCYEEMEYSEIAEEMDCSEFSARVLFFRAKKSLAKQLSRRGLGKGALLSALVLFGKMTAPSEAAASQIGVTAAATKVGVAAALAGTAGSKAVLVSLAAASVITVGSIVVTPDSGGFGGVTKSGGSGSGRVVSSGLKQGIVSLNRNVKQCWHFFPGGPGGSVMMRQMMPSSRHDQPYCLWLQNDAGNFYYDKSKGTVYQNNYRIWSKSLSVMRLPTDSGEFSRFLSQVEGESVDMEYVSESHSGLLVITSPDEKTGGSVSQVMRHPSVLYEEYYQYTWPHDVRSVDNRDEMHKRGWSYFAVTGEIDGEKVKGVGRIPFVYESSRTNEPWLKLQLGDRLLVADGVNGTYVYDIEKRLLTRYPRGSFFAGLGRPWKGLHSIDTVRRDAASERIRFESRYTRGTSEAEVKVFGGRGEMVYSIDMFNDLIESIEFDFAAGDGQEHGGVLSFSYVDDIEVLESEIVIPRAGRSVKGGPTNGIMWLFNFAAQSVQR